VKVIAPMIACDAVLSKLASAPNKIFDLAQSPHHWAARTPSNGAPSGLRGIMAGVIEWNARDKQALALRVQMIAT
jgi:hypothetical protein